MNKKPYIFHPFLCAIYPIIVLYYHNIRYSSFSDILFSLAAVLCFTFLFLYLPRLMRINKYKAGIVLTASLFIFFSYGHVSGLIRKHELIKNAFSRDIFLIFSSSVLFIIIVYIIKKIKSNLHNTTRILNFMFTILILISLFNIISYKLKTRKTHSVIKSANSLNTGTANVLGSGRSTTLPDIYYIILDRYAGDGVLRDYYDYDNSEFSDFLSDRGFYIASTSSANYHRTAHSLASSLNMEHITYLRETMGEDSDDWKPLFGLLQDYKVWRFLKSKGYTFIHFGSAYKATEINIYADKNYNFHAMPEFVRVLYMTTVLYPIAEYLNIFDIRKLKWKRVPYKFEKLAEIPNMKEPTFIFAHMLVPHAPSVFDMNGDYVSKTQERERSRKINYINQLIYTNKKVEELIDKLLSRSKVKPIIVLQSDEGPCPERFLREAHRFNWENASMDEVKIKMKILNAYYLPNIDKNILYPSITPVNSFRLIFNRYFDTDFKLLPDESYTFQDEYHIYKFINVTDILK